MFYKLLKGDCIELMKDIPDNSIDMVLTDPPYGIDYQSNRIKNKFKRKEKILNDKKPFVDFIPLIKNKIKKDGSIMIFTRWDVQQKFIDILNENDMKVKNILIWDKIIHGMGDLKRSYGNRYESIIFSNKKEFRFKCKRPQDIITERKVVPKDLIHPNEKPVKLLMKIISQCTNENDIIFDPFMGSCSTGVACVKLKRNFIGCELDNKYFELSSKRIQKEIYKNE